MFIDDTVVEGGILDGDVGPCIGPLLFSTLDAPSGSTLAQGAGSRGARAREELAGLSSLTDARIS